MKYGSCPLIFQHEVKFYNTKLSISIGPTPSLTRTPLNSSSFQTFVQLKWVVFLLLSFSIQFRFFLNIDSSFVFPQKIDAAAILSGKKCQRHSKQCTMHSACLSPIYILGSFFAKSTYILVSGLFIPQQYNSGPPRQIFGWQGCHSGGHFTSALPPLFSISQNPAKDQALAALIVSRQICRLLKGVSALTSQHSKFIVQEIGNQKKRNTFQISGIPIKIKLQDN